jgi:hypothetical protein
MTGAPLLPEAHSMTLLSYVPLRIRPNSRALERHCRLTVARRPRWAGQNGDRVARVAEK